MKSLHWSEPPDAGDLALVMHHNSSFTGDIKINLPADRVAPLEEWAGHVQVSIPFDALKVLVAEYVYSRRVQALEDAEGNPDDILFGRVNP